MRISRKNRRFDELLDSFFFFNVKYTIDRGEIYEKFVLDSWYESNDDRWINCSRLIFMGRARD